MINRNKLNKELKKQVRTIKTEYDLSSREKEKYKKYLTEFKSELSKDVKLKEKQSENSEKIGVNYEKALAYATAGEIKRQIELYEDALEKLNYAIKLNPNLAWAYERKGAVLREMRKYREAIITLKKSLAIREIAWTHTELGECYFKNGDKELAIKEVDRALELDANLQWALERKGRILRSMNLNEESVSFLKRALEIDPENTYLHSELGESYRKLGRLKDALAEQDEALNINSSYIRALERKGRILRLLNQHEYAIEVLKRALELNPLNAWVNWELAESFCRLGQSKEAFEAKSRAIDLDPNSMNHWIEKAGTDTCLKTLK